MTEPPQYVQPRPRPHVRVPRRGFAIGLAGLSVAVTALRFGPRDGIQILAPVFYATPPVITVALAFLAWAVIRRKATRPLKWTLGLLLLAQLGLLAATWQTAQPRTATIRLGFWNICSGNLGWDRVVEQIHTWDADIIGLAESNRDPYYDDIAARDRYWEERFPGYTMIRFPRGMRLLTRYPAKSVSRGRLGRRSNYGVAELTIDGQRVWLVMADLLSGPTLPRQPAFDGLREILAELAPGPVIVMGDMNTPVSSVHVDPMREQYRNAFEECGEGFYHTWPVPFPVLSLDHIWFNNGIRPGTCELQWTTRSDHRPLLFTFDLTP